MKPTRRTQPHRKGGRRSNGALAAMLRGGPGPGMSNPQNYNRELEKRAQRARSLLVARLNAGKKPTRKRAVDDQIEDYAKRPDSMGRYGPKRKGKRRAGDFYRPSRMRRT